MLLKVFNNILTECILRLTSSWSSWQIWLFASSLHLINSALARPCCWAVLSLLSWCSCCQLSALCEDGKVAGILMQDECLLKEQGFHSPWVSSFLHLLTAKCPAVVLTAPPQQTAFSPLVGVFEHQFSGMNIFLDGFLCSCFNSDVNILSQLSLIRCVHANQKVWQQLSQILEEC